MAKWLQGIPEKNLASFCLWLVKEAHSTSMYYITCFLMDELISCISTVKRKSSSGVGLKILIQLLSTKFPAVSVRCVNSTAFQERFSVPTSAWEDIKVGPEHYSKQHKNLPKILPAEAKVLRPNMIHTLVWFLGQPVKDAPSVALSCTFFLPPSFL